MIRPTDELSHESVCRLKINFKRIADLHNLALIDDSYLIGESNSFALVMGHVEGRDGRSYSAAVSIRFAFHPGVGRRGWTTAHQATKA